MSKNGRHSFKRRYVRVKQWLTLGSIGIMPRLIVAFASVAALAATANLIVENGVAILEQQRNVALERSALDAIPLPPQLNIENGEIGPGVLGETECIGNGLGTADHLKTDEA